MGLLRLPVASEEVAAELLHREPFALFLPAAHPLSRRKHVRLEQLQGEKFVMYSRKLAPGFHDLTMGMLRSGGLNPTIAQEAGEMYTIIALVAAGLGVAVLPRSVELHRIPGVVSRGLPGGLPFSEIGIAVRKDETSPAVKLFHEVALSMKGDLAKLRVPITKVPLKGAAGTHEVAVRTRWCRIRATPESKGVSSIAKDLASGNSAVARSVRV